MNIINWIMKLYPLTWRERYEEEMRAVLEEHHYTLWTLLDLLFGALDARIDPYYNRENPFFSLRSLRVSNIVFIYAFAVAVCCASLWLTFPSVSVPPPMYRVPDMYHLPPPPISLIIAGNSYQVLFLLLVLSNIFIVSIYVRQAIVARQRGRLLLAAICFVLPIVVIELIPAYTFDIHYGFLSLYYTVLQIIGAELLLGNVVLLVSKLITTRTFSLPFFIIITEVLFFVVPALFHLSYFNMYTYPPNHTVGLSTIADFGAILWEVQAPFAALATTIIFVTTNQLNRRVARSVLVFAVLIILTTTLNVSASLIWSVSYLTQGQIEDRWIVSVITVSIVSVIAIGIAFVALRKGIIQLARHT